MKKAKPVQIVIRIKHPKNRMTKCGTWRYHGTQNLQKVSCFYLKRETRRALERYGFSTDVADVDIILNGQHVTLDSVGTDGIARFWPVPKA